MEGWLDFPRLSKVRGDPCAESRSNAGAPRGGGARQCAVVGIPSDFGYAGSALGFALLWGNFIIDV
jgi:hypothetical protein